MVEVEEKTLNQKIGELLQKTRTARNNLDDNINRVKYLEDAADLIFKGETETLDNFLDEMLEFLGEREDDPVNFFTLRFIIRAIKTDPDILKKTMNSLIWALRHDTAYGQAVQKKVIITCAHIYPDVLKWALVKKNDPEVVKSWKLFGSLKTSILALIDSSNEGLRMYCAKFMETVILCQSTKSEFSVITPDQEVFCVAGGNLIDHRFISQRQLESETNHNFDRLIEELSSSSVTSQTILVILQIVCNIAKQRPERMAKVLSTLESLHVNLPPTLATHQVKSLRKELRYHMLKMLKHPTNFQNHSRLQHLLSELGCSSGEIDRNMPDRHEVIVTLQKRTQLAKAAAIASSSSSGAFHQPGPSTSGAATKRPSDTDGPADAKRFKLDDDEYLDEGTVEILRGADGGRREDLVDASQKAIEITSKFAYERLSLNVVVKLVTISLVTLPDEMPPAFASTYTRIDNAGSEDQKKHLARILAMQITKEGEGPGIKHIRQLKQQQYLARQNARTEGHSIPPTPGREEDDAKVDTADEAFAKPLLPKKTRITEWDILKITKELMPPAAQKLSVMAFQRIMDNEKRAIQGGAFLAQQQLLVRLAARYISVTHEIFAEMLIEYVVADQKSRAELALLWLNELFAQYGGYSIVAEKEIENRFIRYDKALCSMLGLLFNRKDNKETLFHRILLEVPMVTQAALIWLKKACLDPVYGAFGMTTLREMILTRPKTRHELLELFLSFSYYEPQTSGERSGQIIYDAREHCVNTAKELYSVDYVREDLRDAVLKMSEQLTLPTAPKQLVIQCRRLTEEEANDLPDQVAWDEQLIRAGLHLFISLLPVEHSLMAEQKVTVEYTFLQHLANITAKAVNDVKRVTFRCIDQAIKAIGMQSPKLLEVIESCPVGAEPLIARILHLLTERNAPTPELVGAVRRLRQKRDIDVRSLIPILAGLDREELLELIPKFVVNAANMKSVPAFFRKLIFGRHIKTHEPLMTPVQLLVELHRVKPANIREEDVDLLIVDQEGLYQLGKDVVAQAVEQLIDEQPIPKLLYHSLQKIYEQHPSLKGFLTNVVTEIAQKHQDNEKLQILLGKFNQNRENISTQVINVQS